MTTTPLSAGMTGFNSTSLHDNLYPGFADKQSFFSVTTDIVIVTSSLLSYTGRCDKTGHKISRISRALVTLVDLKITTDCNIVPKVMRNTASLK